MKCWEIVRIKIETKSFLNLVYIFTVTHLCFHPQMLSAFKMQLPICSTAFILMFFNLLQTRLLSL